MGLQVVVEVAAPDQPGQEEYLALGLERVLQGQHEPVADQLKNSPFRGSEFGKLMLSLGLDHIVLLLEPAHHNLAIEALADDPDHLKVSDGEGGVVGLPPEQDLLAGGRQVAGIVLAAGLLGAPELAALGVGLGRDQVVQAEFVHVVDGHGLAVVQLAVDRGDRLEDGVPVLCGGIAVIIIVPDMHDELERAGADCQAVQPGHWDGPLDALAGVQLAEEVGLGDDVIEVLGRDHQQPLLPLVALVVLGQGHAEEDVLLDYLAQSPDAAHIIIAHSYTNWPKRALLRVVRSGCDSRCMHL